MGRITWKDSLGEVLQPLNCIQLFVFPWAAACQTSLSFVIYLSLLKLVSIESVMPSNTLILCCLLLLLPAIFPSIRVFSNELAFHIRWPEYWSFSFSISLSLSLSLSLNEYSGLISFRIDWLWSLHCPRDSQESSPAPQLKSINSSPFSLLYGPTLTSTHD